MNKHLSRCQFNKCIISFVFSMALKVTLGHPLYSQENRTISVGKFCTLVAMVDLDGLHCPALLNRTFEVTMKRTSSLSAEVCNLFHTAASLCSSLELPASMADSGARQEMGTHSSQRKGQASLFYLVRGLSVPALKGQLWGFKGEEVKIIPQEVQWASQTTK